MKSVLLSRRDKTLLVRQLADETSGNNEIIGSTRQGLNIIVDFQTSGLYRRLLILKPFGIFILLMQESYLRTIPKGLNLNNAA